MRLIRKPVLSQRGALWQAKVYHGRFNGVSKYIYASGPTEAEATAAAYQKMREVAPVTAASEMLKGKLLLNDWMAREFDFMRQKRKRGTMFVYEQTYADYLKPLLGSKQVKLITALDVETVVMTMEQRGLSASTIKTTIGILSRALDRARKHKIIFSNPCVDVELPRKTRQPMIPLTVEHIQAILAALKDSWWHDAVLFAVHAGVRRGELFGLRRCDVSQTENVVTIGNQVLYFRKHLWTDTPKSAAGFRRIALDASVMQMLRDRVATLSHLGPDDPVFPNREGGWQLPNSLNHALAKLGKRLGIPSWPHLFRHSHASQLLRATGDLAQISKRLGHANAQVTATIYSHAMEDIDHGLATTMGALLAPKQTNLGAALGAKAEFNERKLRKSTS